MVQASMATDSRAAGLTPKRFITGAPSRRPHKSVIPPPTTSVYTWPVLSGGPSPPGTIQHIGRWQAFGPGTVISASA